MPDPTERDTWTPEDDDLVRSALRSLREDVDHLHLAPVETVKARAGHRRRASWLAGGLGLAAAAALVGAVALSGVLDPALEDSAPATRGNTSITTPAPSRSSSSSSSTTSDDWRTQVDWAALLKQPGILPTTAEWRAILGEPGVSTREGMVPTDILCAMSPAPGTAVSAQEISIPGRSGSLGVQVTWIYDTDDAAMAAANAMRKRADNCSTGKPEHISAVSSDRYSEHPFMWSFDDTDGNRGWLTVTDRGRMVTYVEFSGQTDGTSMLTLDRFAWLNNRVENRLERYGESTTAGAIVVGPANLTPESWHFVDPADFASQVFTGGKATESGPGEFEGSAAVVACDTDSGDQGRFGLMKVKLAGKDASYFATERVRDYDNGDSADQAADELIAALGSCRRDVADNPVKVTAGPQAGIFALATTLGDGSVFTSYVAVQPSTDGKRLTTLVVSPQDKVDQDAAFTELVRLRGLAAAR